MSAALKLPGLRRRLGLSPRLGAPTGKQGGGGQNPLGSVIMPLGAYDSAQTNRTNQSGTTFAKMDAESDFVGVYLWLLSSQAAPVDGFTAKVAATETAISDDTNQAFYPYQGGARDDTLWKQVTFQGANAVQTPVGAGTVVLSSPNQYVRPGIVRSDFIPMKSIPRADGGKRPLLMLRVFNGPSTTLLRGISAAATTYVNYPQNLGKEYDRVQQIATTHPATQPGVDAVSDVTIPPLNGVSAVPSPNLGGGNGLCWFAVEFVYKTAAKRTVLALGDSITCRYASFRNGFDHWLPKLIWGASDAVEPITFVNGGFNGRTSAEWIPWYSELIAQTGWRPDVVLMSSFEVNDDVNAGTAGADIRHAAESAIIDDCIAHGTQVLLWTPQPRDDYGSTQDAVRLYSDQWARDQVAAGRAKLVDFRSVLAQPGVSPERYIAGWTADNIHPLPLAGDAMTALALPLIQSAHAPRVTRDTGILGWSYVGGTLYAIPALVTSKNGVTGRTYRWLRAGVLVATGNTYTPVSADGGNNLTLEETITDANGSVVSTSSAVAISATAPTVAADYGSDISTLTLTNITTALGADTHPLTGAAVNQLLEAAGTTVAHSVALPAIGASAAGTAYTVWALVKFQTKGAVQLSVSSSTFNAAMFANFDIQNGKVKQPSNGAARILPVWISGTLWFYIELTGVATANLAPDPQLWSVANTGASRRATYTGAVTNTFELAQLRVEKSASKFVHTLPLTN